MSFFFLLPNILLSRLHVPVRGHAAPGAVLAQALPLTHFLRIVRGIALKGAGFADAAPRARLAGRHPGRARDARLAALPQEARLMARPRSDIAPRILHAARERFLAEGVDGASLRAHRRATPAPASA